MNAFLIKVIAVLCMVSSHVGIFILPEYPILKIVGSVTFPLFAWLIANGAYHTTDVNSYLTRLFLFALASQIPFTLANQQIGSPLLYLNVFFTLFLGLLAISVVKKTSHVGLWVTVIFGCAAIAQALNTDYGAAGVLTIVASYFFFENIYLLAFSHTFLLHLVPASLPFIEEYGGAMLARAYLDHPVRLVGILAAIGIVWLYNKQEGYKIKAPFYIFYPLHYLAIFIFKLVF